MFSLRRSIAALAAVGALVLSACAPSSPSANSDASAASTGGNVVAHAFGETVIPEKVERVAAIAWGNHEVPLALGVMPVGMAKQAWGVTDDSGMHVWVKEAVEKLGGTAPVLFDEAEGLNFEAIAATKPDVILAAYSGITQEDYEKLSKIAPTVAYPETPWNTPWREMVTMDAAAMNKASEGAAYIAEVEKKLAQAVAAHPELKGKTAALFYGSTEDLSQVGFYGTRDPRTAFLGDLGLEIPTSVQEATKSTEDFHIQVSAENADKLSDVDIIVMYGTDADLAKYQADPLLGTIPAFKNGSVVFVGNGDTALSAAVGATPLSIPWVVDEYVGKLAEAAAKVKK